jgi:hypothetical protein
MSKQYEIQVKFGKTWVIVEKKNLYNDALHYVKENSGETYPMRIIRVIKTIVFEGN